MAVSLPGLSRPQHLALPAAPDPAAGPGRLRASEVRVLCREGVPGSGSHFLGLASLSSPPPVQGTAPHALGQPPRLTCGLLHRPVTPPAADSRNSSPQRAGWFLSLLDAGRFCSPCLLSLGKRHFYRISVAITGDSRHPLSLPIPPCPQGKGCRPEMRATHCVYLQAGRNGAGPWYQFQAIIYVPVT